MEKTVKVLAEVFDERERQDQKWREQKHPDATELEVELNKD